MSGAVNLPVEIDGATYSLVFKFGTIRLAEGELGGDTVFQIMADGRLGANALSAIFWAVLQPKHRMTREGADDLIDEAGVTQVGQWIGEGLRRYFGKSAVKTDDAGNAPKAPAKRKTSRKS